MASVICGWSFILAYPLRRQVTLLRLVTKRSTSCLPAFVPELQVNSKRAQCCSTLRLLVIMGVSPGWRVQARFPEESTVTLLALIESPAGDANPERAYGSTRLTTGRFDPAHHRSGKSLNLNQTSVQSDCVRILPLLSEVYRIREFRIQNGGGNPESPHPLSFWSYVSVFRWAQSVPGTESPSHLDL